MYIFLSPSASLLNFSLLSSLFIKRKLTAALFVSQNGPFPKN
jgi:hypothetical protein